MAIISFMHILPSSTQRLRTLWYRPSSTLAKRFTPAPPAPSEPSPTIVTEINSPASIPIIWKTEWKRWDGKPYTTAYAAGFAETESDLVYMALYSKDGGQSWLNMKTDAPETPGTLPWIVGTGPDPARTLARGWSLTRTADGRLVRSPDDVTAGDHLHTRVADGEIRSTVDA